MTVRRGPRLRWSDRQRELLDALEGIFFAEGFAHLRVGDLAARLHISRRALYQLAPGKQELVELVIERMFNRMGKQALVQLSQAEDPVERIAVYLGTGVTTVRHAGLQFSHDIEANTGTRAVYDRHQAIGMRTLEQLIDEGVQRGDFRPVPAAVVAQMVDAAHTRVRQPHVLEAVGYTHAEAVRELIRLVLYGLGADRDSRPEGAEMREASSAPPAGRT